MMRSKDNNAPALDTLMVSSFGWGTDPNKYLRVNAEKTKAYRFDANYRRFDYFNSLNNLALGAERRHWHVEIFNLTAGNLFHRATGAASSILPVSGEVECR